MHNIIHPRGSVPWPWNMSFIFHKPLKQRLGIFAHYPYIQVDLGKLGWSYTPGTMRKNYCSSHEYLQGTLFIPISFLITIINSVTIIKNTNITHNILTITIHCSYYNQVLPKKVR